MKLTRSKLAVGLAGGVVLLTCAAFIQDAGSGGDAKAAAAMQEGMKKWQASGKPGPQHKALERLLGKWDTEVVVPGMGGPPMKSSGTAEFTWLFEGRWMQQNWSESLMGMPVTGHTIMGYDNFKQKYTTASVNTLETTLLTSEGNFDQSGNTLITYGLMDEPMTGENDKMVQYIWRLSPDRIVFEIHDLAIGETNNKVIEITYTRHK